MALKAKKKKAEPAAPAPVNPPAPALAPENPVDRILGKIIGKAKAKTEEKVGSPVEIKVSKYKGRTTGLRVMEFQDSLFEANATAMLTDEELVAAWRAEFPNAVVFTPFHVKGARRDYNIGKHSKKYADRKPATPLAEVIITDGKRHFLTAETKPKAAPKAEPAPKPEPESKPAPAPAVAAPVKGKNKKGHKKAA